MKLISLLLILFMTQFAFAQVEQTVDDKRRAAGHPATSSEDLQRYASDSDWRVRLVVARRQTTPANILIQLATDELV